MLKTRLSPPIYLQFENIMKKIIINYKSHEEIVPVSKAWEGGGFELNCLPGIIIIILVAGVATYLLLTKGRKSEK